MNAKKLMLAAVVSTVAGTAFADASEQYVDHSRFVSTKSRAEVRAELEQAYADGSYSLSTAPQFVEFTHVASTRTRDEVQKEAMQETARARQVHFGG